MQKYCKAGTGGVREELTLRPISLAHLHKPFTQL